MRDAERIDGILEEIGTIWKTMPDLRLFQLLNIMTQGNDYYYVEDEDFLEKGKKNVEQIFTMRKGGK